MSCFRYIEKGNGPIKLFVGGIHGKEGITTINILKSLNPNDFSNGTTLIYNFDKSDYISTLKEEYYSSENGKKIISLIKEYNPDFYTELHCYNIKHYNQLVNESRRDLHGVPPLIELKNKILVSSVSPIIRKKYFKKENVCKLIEIPCIQSLTNNKNSEAKELSLKTCVDFLKIIAISKNRKDFEERIIAIYPKQVELAIKYAKEVFGEYFPPF
jgi:hypothetical protein